jgi:hypothetical protein
MPPTACEQRVCNHRTPDNFNCPASNLAHRLLLRTLSRPLLDRGMSRRTADPPITLTCQALGVGCRLTPTVSTHSASSIDVDVAVGQSEGIRTSHTARARSLIIFILGAAASDSSAVASAERTSVGAWLDWSYRLHQKSRISVFDGQVVLAVAVLPA